MPPLVDQPGVLRVELLWTVGEDAHCLTRIFLRNTGGSPSNANCVTMAGLVNAAVVSDLIPLLCDVNAYRGSIVTDLTTATSGTGENLATTAGSRGGAELPADACVLLNYAISRRYRGGKPRSYIPFGVAADLNDPQTWTSAFVSAVQVGFQDFVDALLAMTTGGVVITGLVNVSYYQGFTAVQNPITGRWRNVPKPRAVAITPDAVSSFAVNPKVGSQRRRVLHST